MGTVKAIVYNHTLNIEEEGPMAASRERRSLAEWIIVEFKEFSGRPFFNSPGKQKRVPIKKIR